MLSHGVSSVLLGENILLLFLVLLVTESLELGHDLVDTELSADVVSGWHNVVNVDVLNERLNLDSVSDSLLGEALVNSSWVSVDACNEAMRELPLSSASLVNTENDGLSACVSSAQKNHDSTDLEDLSC